MTDFFSQGILHITDLEGYDHMLFLLALSAPYSYQKWKSLVWLSTAFTVGHSVSLGLAAGDLLHFSSRIIESLIPITIALTSLGNIWMATKTNWKTTTVFRYTVAVFFGIIHGMGFSGFFRMIANDGESFVMQLLFFNLGVEVGQVIIVMFILGLIAVLRNLFAGKEKKIVLVISSFALTVSLILLSQRF